MNMIVSSLPYRPDSSFFYEKIAHLPHPVFLDSGSPYRPGHYDILSGDPCALLTTQNGITEINENGKKEQSTENPFLLLEKKLAQYTPTSSHIDLPFYGGAIGYFSYDLARHLEKIPQQAENDLNLPDMVIGIYEWAVVVNHVKKEAWLVCKENETEKRLALLSMNHVPTDTDFSLLSDFESNLSQEKYADAFQKIQKHLRAGDCYQVNLAQRFSAKITGSAWGAYQKLRQHNPARYGAFLTLPDAHILSFSPEQFLQVKEKIIGTKPIKGTRPRGMTPEEDQTLANALLQNEKERAENVMIVDLLRNDLSKNALPHSISVPHLCSLETLPSVHHLVSEIKGTLSPEKNSIDLLRGCFPGGSITGAPKLRSMEIIESVEPHRRGPYCGSIGYINFDGSMDLNIAIRTLTWKGENIYCYAGGAITIESTLAEEYAESFSKVNILLNLLKNPPR